MLGPMWGRLNDDWAYLESILNEVRSTWSSTNQYNLNILFWFLFSDNNQSSQAHVARLSGIQNGFADSRKGLKSNSFVPVG